MQEKLHKQLWKKIYDILLTKSIYFSMSTTFESEGTFIKSKIGVKIREFDVASFLKL